MSKIYQKTNDPIFDNVAYYIAQLCLNIFYICSIEKIVIGGGISGVPDLLEKVKKEFDLLNGNYAPVDIDQLIYMNEFNESALYGGVYLHQLN